MKVYRVGIVGLTGIAAGAPGAAPVSILGNEAPHTHAASYAEVPNTQVVAFCDLVPRLLDDFRTRWGETWPRAT